MTLAATTNAQASNADKFLKPLVKIHNGEPENNWGSGYWAMPNKVVTAWHVVEDFMDNPEDIRVVDQAGSPYRLVQIDRAENRDIAVLSLAVAAGEGKTAPFRCSYLDVLDEVVVAGHPIKLDNIVTTGHVVGHTEMRGKFAGKIILVDAVINPGNSGGPAYDKQGNVVGVVSAGYSMSMPPQFKVDEEGNNEPMFKPMPDLSKAGIEIITPFASVQEICKKGYNE